MATRPTFDDHIDRSRPWSRAALGDLVRGNVVFLRDSAGEPVPVPDWIRDGAADVLEEPLSDLLGRLHSDDSVPTAQAFLDSVMTPGQIVPVDARVYYRQEWGHWRLQWLNLLDDDDVQAVVAAVVRLPGPCIDGPIRDVGRPYEASSWMIYYIEDYDSTVVRVDGKSRELLGYEPEEIVGHRVMEFLHPDEIPEAISSWLQMSRHDGASWTSERRWRRKDGSDVWIESSYLNRKQPDGGGDVLVVVWDVTERRAQQAALQESNDENRRLADEANRLAAEATALAEESGRLARAEGRLAEQARMLAEDFRMLADEVPSAVFRCDPDGRVTFHNARWAELLGLDASASADASDLSDPSDPSDVMTGGTAVLRVHDVVHPQDRSALDALFAAALRPGGSPPPAIEARAASGDRILAVRARSVPGSDAAHRRIVGSIDDVTATVRLRREARHDPLTGLLNRAALEDEVAGALATGPAETLVVFIDLDGFKQVNDTYGHDAGDAVLIEMGRRLSVAVRPGDSVGRYGGDEFVVVCRHVADGTAGIVVSRLDRALTGPVGFAGGTWTARASLGSAVPHPDEDLAGVLRRADMAMFEVKRRRGAGRLHSDRD